MSSSVQEYYERNTSRFLRYGGGSDVGAIHRKLWAPGVETRDQALLFINNWIVNQLQTHKTKSGPTARYLDLGCGVGGTAVFVAKKTGSKVHGLTLSPKQAQIAIRRASELELDDRCSFVVANYEALPTKQQYDAAIAIESFAHSTNPAGFFQQISKCLQSGALLIIVDDMLAECVDESSPANEHSPWLRRFKEGWDLGSVLKPSRIHDLADKSGLRLRSTHNLSTYIQTNDGIRRRILSWIGRLPLPGAYWQSLSGGIALQECISSGWVEYTGLVFQKH